jgi:hypothetical protein
MKNALLLAAAFFVSCMLILQITIMVLGTFYPESLESVSNVIEGVYEKIG